MEAALYRGGTAMSESVELAEESRFRGYTSERGRANHTTIEMLSCGRSWHRHKGVGASGAC